MHGVIARLARRHVARLSDRYLRMPRARRQHRGPQGSGRERACDEAGHEHRVPVTRDADRGLAAEDAPHARGDVRGRCPEGGVVGAQRVAVQVAVLALGGPRLVSVKQRVPARRLADGAVLKRLGSRPGTSRHRDQDEREPQHESRAAGDGCSSGRGGPVRCACACVERSHARAGFPSRAAGVLRVRLAGRRAV